MRAWMFLGPIMLAACSGSYEPPRLTEKQTMRLEAALAGKVAGEKVSCISRFGQTNLTAISDSVLLYRVSGRLVYRNDLIGSCSGLSRGDTLIVESHTSQLCRGDMARSADLLASMVTGSCALGDFTPYRTPAR
ncbi:hypothetical protein [Sphingobium bisphenolivorans]|uniref:hypothetical protein n=1 Tax=Sphingobium bisphenolivorans TaxID=1335760 RepID=UPI00039BB9A0|nr:hypothetical protein [Sphingobium bisphenolivorans]